MTFAVRDLIHSVRAERGKDWQGFLLFVALYLIAMLVCSSLPTPGSWSDTRSQWLPSAAMVVCACALFVASLRIYRRIGLIFKAQALFLWFLFGAAFLVGVISLYESFTFLRVVRAGQM
jgi:hypothetical protein